MVGACGVAFGATLLLRACLGPDSGGRRTAPCSAPHLHAVTSIISKHITLLRSIDLPCRTQAVAFESFLRPLFAYNAEARPAASDALRHPWLAPAGRPAAKKWAGQMWEDTESEEYNSEEAEGAVRDLFGGGGGDTAGSSSGHVGGKLEGMASAGRHQIGSEGKAGKGGK